MKVLNQGLMKSVRSSAKEGMANLSKGKIKSGKEIIRATHQKFVEKSIRRHSAMLQKFVSEKGQGAKIDFSI
ncbi:MAG: hypothetical protein V3S16_08035 [Candidatus Desulfatibia sp.]|uniref:hypothetical protein n=1 Tax=Candidatus Desulfatibia sp. TaxID=3101189 RepID=UPI002F2E59AD